MTKQYLNLNQSVEFIKAWEAQIKEAEEKELVWNIPIVEDESSNSLDKSMNTLYNDLETPDSTED